jgi:D-alanine-D-alanine ligase
MGGVGHERPISLESGRNVELSLRGEGAKVTAADVGPDNLEILDAGGIDVFFVAMHGKFGEDGRLQQILEQRRLVYTGSGPAACRLAFDKLAAKEAFASAGIETPPAVEYDPAAGERQLLERLASMGPRYVVKPRRQGSSIGVRVVSGPAAAAAAAKEVFGGFGDCFIEKFIPGREITAGIIRGRVLPLIEVRSAGGFYDYRAKYSDPRTRCLFDTVIEGDLASRIESAAIACFKALRLRHFARVDFIVTGDGVVFALEVNAIPGLTGHSLLPKAAEKAGISMGRLCMSVVDAALDNSAVSMTGGR